MKLVRLYAYAVSPMKNVEHAEPPSGGAVRVTPDIRTTFEGMAVSAEAKIQVDFAVDTTTRTNDSRDRVMQFAFEASAAARSAATSLAASLAERMDRRSSACLLVLGSLRDADRARVFILTFPKEDALRLRSGGEEATIQVLTDVFSQTSRLRKAALFEGKNRKTAFLSGKVLDFQATTGSHPAADFWITDFLQCVLAMHGEAGTRELAKCLRRTYEAAETPAEKEELYAAILSVRRSPRPRWSLRSFADTYLAGRVKTEFIDAASNAAIVDSAFDFVPTVFDQALNFRVFRLEGEVFVSAPFDQIGNGRPVVVTGVEEKHLRCEGVVVDESLKTRHA